MEHFLVGMTICIHTKTKYIHRKKLYCIFNFQARNLKHNPETYMQFGSLSIQPPISSKEVPIVIEKLKSKKVST